MPGNDHLFPLLNAFERPEEVTLFFFTEDDDDDDDELNSDEEDEDNDDDGDEEMADQPLLVQPPQPGLFQPLRIQPHLSILRLSLQGHLMGFQQFQQLFASFPGMVEMELRIQRMLNFNESVIYLNLPQFT